MARVMVVDDAAVDREALARVLRREGHEAVTARDADQALTLLRRGPSRPDVILVDVKTPGPDGGGLEVLETLQADPAWRPLPVVMLTGCSDTHGLNRAAQLGARQCGAEQGKVSAALSVADAMDQVRQFAN